MVHARQVCGPRLDKVREVGPRHERELEVVVVEYVREAPRQQPEPIIPAESTGELGDAKDFDRSKGLRNRNSVMRSISRGREVSGLIRQEPPTLLP